MNASVRLDLASSVRLGATPIDVRPDGYRVYRGVATYGDVVLPYPELGGSEFRPASEVMSPEAVASMVGVPFTIHHPDELLAAEDEENIRRHQVGTVLAARVNPAVTPPALEVDVIVHQRSAQQAVESGEVAELSPGYRCADERAPPGSAFQGQPYQTIQRRHRYNHLSGVLSARTVLPDGRRARLDEMPTAESAYPRNENTSMAIKTDVSDTTVNDAKVCDAVDPAAVLAKFSPEDAEILKTLSPDGLAMLAALGVTAAGEVAEEAIEEAAEGEAEAAVMPSVEVDALSPAAAGALTKEMVDQMIADALAKMSPKKDAAAGAGPATADARLDADAIIAQAAERARAAARTDAALVDAVRRDGHDVRSYDDACATMLAVIEQHTPRHLPRAREDMKAGRMDALRVAYEAAEDIRRDALVDAQGGLVRDVLDSSGDGLRSANVDSFRLPTRGNGRAIVTSP